MIPKNAITMRGTIDRCWLVALRADPEAVREALPQPLQPILFGGFAYLGIVVSHLRSMRPAPLPHWMGLAYWHAAYRIYAKHEPPGRPAIEGLWFLRSDADSRIMSLAGNLLTDFRFHHSPIRVESEEGRITLSVASAPNPLRITLGPNPARSDGSPFESLDEAAKFLEYSPAGLSVVGDEVHVMKITRDQTKWNDRLLQVASIEAPLLDRFHAVPEVAYEVDPINYQWNRADRYKVLV